MKRILFAFSLALSLSAQANSIGDWIEVTFSTGHTHIPKTFEHARFAFPDLAQGGPGCCAESSTRDNLLPAFKIAAAKQYGAWGVEGSLAYLGSAYVAFEVSGPFGDSVKGPGNGRCNESGNLSLTSLAVAGTYSYPMGGVVLVPKLGMSANWVSVKTQSHCDLANYTATVDVRQDYTVYSASPLVGAAVKYQLTKEYGLSLELEGRQVLFSNNDEAQSYGQGNPVVLSAWFGVSRKF